MRKNLFLHFVFVVVWLERKVEAFLVVIFLLFPEKNGER